MCMQGLTSPFKYIVKANEKRWLSKWLLHAQTDAKIHKLLDKKRNWIHPKEAHKTMDSRRKDKGYFWM